jgi:acetoin utilization deacetylase AcuC-like enzyme
VRCLTRTARVPDLDVDRADRVLALLASERLIAAADIRAAVPASMAALARVHSLDHLESATTAATLGRIFGLEAGDIDVDDVVRAQRLAVGGTMAAARWAIADSRRLAFNLGGGFHHADPERGSGFCVFNDVAVAIRELRERGFREPVAIVDLDFHQGDGDLVTFAEDPDVLTFSIHGSAWSHIEAAASEQVLLADRAGDESYLSALEERLGPAVDRHRSRLIFYIAGNDVLAGDALGTFELSPSAALRRDQHVVAVARSRGAPMVVTLGGGYSDRAWRASASFVRWALTRDSVPPRRSSADVRHRFEVVARSLDPGELQHDPAAGDLDEADIVAELTGRPVRRRILGYYSRAGIELALERYGILGRIRDQGFTDLAIADDLRDPERQRLTLTGAKGGARHRVLELIVGRRRIAAGGASFELLSLEWLLLQDPSRELPPGRVRLPEQEHPGLGLGREIVEMLRQSCVRLELDGIVINPSHYHIAAAGNDELLFVDPAVQGRFDAIRAALAGHTLAAASEIADRGTARDAGGEPLRWNPTDCVAPVSERLRRYFESPAYREGREAARRAATAAAAES